MASLNPFVAGTPIIARVRKHAAENPSVLWWNTYEFRTLDAGGVSDLQDLANVLVDFESTMHTNQAVIDQCVISSWVADSHPYNPEGFVSYPYNSIGLRTALGDRLDLRVCLFVKRHVATGRYGKIFYRGALAEGDVEASAGTWVLSDSVAMGVDLANNITDSGLVTYLGPSAETFGMALIGNDEATRFVISLAIGGIVVNKLNHKYFDRA